MRKRTTSLIWSLLKLFAGSGKRSPGTTENPARPRGIKVTMLPPEEFIPYGPNLHSANLGTARVPTPRKRGRTEEQQAADWLEYREKMRANFRLTAERVRTQAAYVGSKKYIWRSCGDGDVCPECAKNDGKRFSWSRPPPGGHPGETTCCSSEWCRCIAEPIIPD
jgi:hypothetical protein